MFNSCQGTPSGPCPNSCCDETVRYSIYDVFVCPACEKTRADTENTLRSGTAGSNAEAKGQTKGKTAKKAVSSSKPPTGSQLRKTAEQSSSAITPVAPARPATRAASVIQDTGAPADNTENNVCPSCLLEICEQNSIDKRSLRCDICSQKYHQRCTAISAKIYDKFITNIDVTGWTCEVCKQAACASLHRVQAALVQLAEELAVVKAELNELRAAQNAVSEPLLPDNAHSLQSASNSNSNSADQPNTDSKTEEHIMILVNRTLSDNTRRKRNVIITGLPETKDQEHDRIAFLRLCEENLPVKPSVADASCVRRIGKNRVSPRRLLVRLGSEGAADSLLKAAPLLRQSSQEYVANNIFINADLSPAAAKLAFEARKLRRAKKQQQERTQPSAGQSDVTDQHHGDVPPALAGDAMAQPSKQSTACDNTMQALPGQQRPSPAKYGASTQAVTSGAIVPNESSFQ